MALDSDSSGKSKSVDTHWWAQTSDQVSARLGVRPNEGLSESEVRPRQERFGINSLVAEKKTSGFIKFIRQFKSPVVLALVAATVVSITLGEWIDATAILVIVVINAFVSLYQEAKAEKAVETLKSLSAPKARILRQGHIVQVDSKDVVPGDVLVFEAGDFIAADARVFEARQLSTIEAALTGESLPVEKYESEISQKSPLAERSNMIFSGTAIANGSGRAIVVATGMKTELGKIAELLEASTIEQTPLQKNLDVVGSRLLYASIAIIALIAVIGFFEKRQPLELLLSAVSLAVAAIPEGLPAVVTVALTLAVHRMVKRRAIVRHLPAVETLGSADVICTDKTGTLTTGQMELRETMTFEEGIGAPSSSSANRTLLSSSALCSNATYDPSGSQTGDPTEVALLKAALSIGLDSEGLQSSHPRFFEWAFDSDRKRMTVAVRGKDGVVLHSKGAPESILACCNISVEAAARIRSAVLELSSQGRRVLAVATARAADVDVRNLKAEEVERNLEFLGLVSIADPPRTESISAIKQCQEAGIRVVMITGDHPVTARAIARELGILLPGVSEGVLTGEDLSKLNDEQLRAKVLETAVYARVSPQDKLKIISAWKANGRVVAMTGDGVNDAPALKVASIGISMGRGGTEVARQASSMILADDNFATIVSAVEEGRAVFGNIRRTVEYLLSGNLAEILVMMGAAVFNWPAPLSPIHLLWINLVTDGIPALALAAEPVPKGILDEERIDTRSAFSSRAFWLRTAIVGSVTGLMCLGVYAYALRTWDEETARTLAFSFLVYAELFRSFASRSERLTFWELGPRSNLLHLAAILAPAIFQFVLHHSTTFQSIFDVRHLTIEECLGIFAITLVPVTVLEITKLLRRKRVAT